MAKGVYIVGRTENCYMYLNDYCAKGHTINIIIAPYRLWQKGSCGVGVCTCTMENWAKVLECVKLKQQVSHAGISLLTT